MQLSNKKLYSPPRSPNHLATQKKQQMDTEWNQSSTKKKLFDANSNINRYAWDKHGRIDGKKQLKNIKQKRLSKQEIVRLYEDLMEKSEYTEAGKVKVAIRYMKDKDNTRRLRQLSEEHSVQKQALKMSHKEEMRYFRQAWREVFKEQAMKDRLLMQHFDRLRAQDEQQCKQRITKRCQSAKPAAEIAKLYRLQSAQKILRKRGKTVQLRQIRDQKRETIEKSRRTQELTFLRIAQQQKKRMTEKQTRRYRSFMHRIEQSQKDNERIYKREQHKLKQKYKNILKNLQHEQSKDFNNVSFSMQNARII